MTLNRTAWIALLLGLRALEAVAASSPNVIIILSDDQGWGDVGFNGRTDIPTPHLDALASDGVVCTQGYASHPYCSPSRAGLLSGRYQHRFGHENNTPYAHPTEDDGLPLSEELLSNTMQRAGYQTIAIGKWHLGDPPRFWPNRRGFTQWFGFHGGGLDYWGNTKNKPATAGVLRNGAIVPRDSLTYVTDDFSEEAAAQIQQCTDANQPFFLYLAYNAPHAPIQAPRKYLDQVTHIENGQRAAYAAMVVGMDHGIGTVVEKLKETGAYNNTLIAFYSDNGGHLHGASSLPFRGHKGMLFEGGIRVPFLISWPDRLDGGKRYEKPVSALDIFPTVLAATETPQPDKLLDGVDLLPFLAGERQQKPHETLFWRYSDGAGYAVRHGNEKLIYSAYKKRQLLFDIGTDPFEHHDLAASHPDRMEALVALYERWNRGNVAAKWHDPHLENVAKEERSRQFSINQASKGERH